MLTLLVDPRVDVTPMHLREHLVLAEAVVVEFARQPNGLVAVRIDDS